MAELPAGGVASVLEGGGLDSKAVPPLEHLGVLTHPTSQNPNNNTTTPPATSTPPWVKLFLCKGFDHCSSLCSSVSAKF